MKDICTDFCEAINCKGCVYENATKEEKDFAMKQMEIILKHMKEDNNGRYNEEIQY